jgi:small-conductance mechanosensitive channel
MKHNPMLTALSDLLDDLRNPEIIWQVATLAACLGLAAWFSARIRARLKRRAEEREAEGRPAARSVRLVEGGVGRLVFPLLALGFVMVGRAVLARFHHVNLLHVAIPLLFALAVIRCVVYLLRHAIAAGQGRAEGERWVASLVWLGVALHFTGLLPEITEALEQVSMPLGTHRVTLLLALQAVVSVLFTLLFTLWLSALIEDRLMAAESIHMSLRVMLARVFKSLLVLAAVLFSLSLVGIDLTVLSVFGGALGVGLGLGLQRIASNYVSGFIILFDRSIRIGDVVTVDKYSGAVTQINTRYTVLKAGDGTEAILPNELLVNSPVSNLSFTTRENRLAITVSVAYDSDLDAVRALLLETAAAHPRVLQEPAPGVFLRQFGADGIDLELGFWIRDPEQGSLNVRSELNFALWEAFKAAGVRIPYPQREVRILGDPDGPGRGG